MNSALFFQAWHGLVLPLCARLPAGLSDWLCVWFFRLNRSYRKDVAAALSQSLPKGLDASYDGLQEKIISGYLDMMARENCDIYCLKHQGLRYLEKTVVLKDAQAARGLFSRPQGKILLLFHFDRITLLSAALGAAGVAHSMVTQPIDHTNPELSKVDSDYLRMKVDVIRSHSGGEWFVAGQQTREITNALRNGQTVILLPDVRPLAATKTIEIPFLGQTLRIPNGAVRLAKATNAEMIYGVAKSQGRSCVVSFCSLPEDPEQALRAAVGELESDILQAPSRWWNWNIFDYLIR